MKLIAFSEFLVNWKRNLFVSLILSVIALTCTTMYGILSYEMRCMAPFKGLEGKRGYYVYGDLEDAVLPDMDICTTYRGEVSLFGGYKEIYCIDEWAYGWKPRLSEGRFEKKKHSDGAVPVVLSGRGSERYDVGDIIKMSVENVTFCVTGKLVDGSGILGQGTDYSIDTVDYRLYYQSSDDEFRIICAKECLEDADIKLYETTSRIYLVGDDVSDEEYDAIYRDIQLKTEGACLKLSDFIENCKNVYVEKILSYLPLVLISILVVVICCFAAIYINYMHSVKRYTIQYIVGCKPWQRMVINLSNCIGIVFLSVCLTAIFLKVLREQGMLSKLTVVTDVGAMFALVVFYLLFMILMIFITWLSMRGRSPKEQLTRIKG